MAVTDFPTKAAVIVRDDVAVWQRLNVTGFLVSGLIGSAEDRVVGEDYVDADGTHYLPMLVQPLLTTWDLEPVAASILSVKGHSRTLARPWVTPPGQSLLRPMRSALTSSRIK